MAGGGVSSEITPDEVRFSFRASFAVPPLTLPVIVAKTKLPHVPESLSPARYRVFAALVLAVPATLVAATQL